MSFMCPICKKILARKSSLAAHIAKYHPEAKNEATGETEAPEDKDANASELELEIPNADVQTFHCVDCGQTGIAKGTENCPNCGERLDWGRLNA